jgi:hypothetical protein
MDELHELDQWLNPKRLGWWIWAFVFSFCLYNTYQWNAATLDTMLMCDSDAEGYYQYLPTLVGDVSFLKMRYAFVLDNGNHLNIFTIGVALLQLPFFLLAVGYSDMIGGPVDYYGADFFIAMCVSTAFYAATAFRLLHLVLGRITSRPSSLIALFFLFFGTNVYYYCTREPLSSHIFSFFLISVLIYIADRAASQGFSAWSVFGTVACAGLVVLIRQPNGLVAFIPFILFTDSTKAARARLSQFLEHRSALSGGLVFCALLWGLQVVYWYAVTGQPYINPYSYKGEGFNWFAPELWNVFFSHQNGLFIYAPILLLAVGYMVIRALKKDITHSFILAIFMILWYIYSAWWCWWLVGFGHRGFIDIYPLLAIPGVLFVENVRQGPGIIAWAIFVLCTFLAGINYELSNLYWWPWEGEAWTWESLIMKWRTALENLLHQGATADGQA